MKRHTILAALPIVLLVRFASAQMLADIRAEVATAFGVYHPYLVTVQPSLPPVAVAPDFSNVVNFNQFAFTASEANLLRQNHFVVSPRRSQGGTGYREMYDIYNEARELGFPILVTTDAMLHTFHLVFDRVLKTCEEQRFYGWLEALLAALYEESRAQQTAATDTLAQWALWRNLEYLNVARRLLDSTYVPAATIGLYQQELDLIRQHLPFTPSPIFEYDEDYTQYIVRGHYTQSDSLRHYFQSMMWLGRMTFDRDSLKFSLSAILLTQALYRTQVNGRPSFAVWDDIYQPTVFFVGKSDDIGPEQYLQIANEVYGQNYLDSPPNQLADRNLLSQFGQMAQALPGPKIEYPGQPAGFRIMGQRFIPDSYVLDELVFDKLPDLRVMPTGLDVMAVLGSARALELLQQTPDWTMFPSYPVKLDSLRREFANYADTTWAQNVYWNWLYCLMPLLYPKGEGYPDWMQTAAWLDKDLLAALGSWAELRHDTILYAKQSGTETGMRPEAVGKQGYVEPNPHLYARLAALTLFMQTGLASRDLLFPQFATSLQRLHNVLTQLQAISEKELEGRPLSAEDYATILTIGNALEEIVEFAERSAGGPRPDNKDAMPVIADVHTDANSGTVLEEGVGYPYCVYAICSIAGQLVIARGAGFSHHEFVWPSTDRLTDEAWREMLQTNAPPPPQWSASFLAEVDWQNPQPDFYYWRASGLLPMPIVLLHSDTVSIGRPVYAEIASYSTTALRVWIATAAGQQAIADSLALFEPGRVIAKVETNGLHAGPAWLVVEAPAPANLTGEALMVYRAGFHLAPTSVVAAPSDQERPQVFALWPSMPNPCNATTTITFDLPKAAGVELVVVDLAGRVVRSLVHGILSAGRHRLLWDGCDAGRRRLARGVYFVRLQAGKEVMARKVLMLQ